MDEKRMVRRIKISTFFQRPVNGNMPMNERRHAYLARAYQPDGSRRRPSRIYSERKSQDDPESGSDSSTVPSHRAFLAENEYAIPIATPPADLAWKITAQQWMRT
ncbi:hypothetical protein TNCT_32591 [Trichonephila clavata]|uniref:Uncharacterized protein n=1 Tax=Trichonephila clavata TaxID=2740835 RepID=A0A8X6LLV5_TRICU|nr:hypothetical protein TNCT_32591 [Trichonephila clavata]